MSADVDLTLRTVADTVLTLARQSVCEKDRTELYNVARRVQTNWDSPCCPVCDEVTCDDGCPLREVRDAS